MVFFVNLPMAAPLYAEVCGVRRRLAKVYTNSVTESQTYQEYNQRLFFISD